MYLIVHILRFSFAVLIAMNETRLFVFLVPRILSLPFSQSFLLHSFYKLPGAVCRIVETHVTKMLMHFLNNQHINSSFGLCRLYGCAFIWFFSFFYLLKLNHYNFECARIGRRQQQSYHLSRPIFFSVYSSFQFCDCLFSLSGPVSSSSNLTIVLWQAKQILFIHFQIKIGFPVECGCLDWKRKHSKNKENNACLKIVYF